MNQSGFYIEMEFVWQEGEGHHIRPRSLELETHDRSDSKLLPMFWWARGCCWGSFEMEGRSK